MQHPPEHLSGPPSQRRGLTAIDVALIAILLIVQMWLLTATLEGVLPAAVISGILLLACFGLYRFVRVVDQEARRR